MKVNRAAQPNVRKLLDDCHTWPEWWAIFMTDRRKLGEPIRLLSRYRRWDGMPTFDPEKALIFPTQKKADQWLKKWVHKEPRWCYTVCRFLREELTMVQQHVLALIDPAADHCQVFGYVGSIPNTGSLTLDSARKYATRAEAIIDWESLAQGPWADVVGQVEPEVDVVFSLLQPTTIDRA